MTEQERAKASSRNWNPIVRLIIENPISALNTAAILFGGGFVYASNESRMEKMETRIVQVEHRLQADIVASNLKDDRSIQRVEAISRELTDVRLTVRGIESSVQFLVQQVQQQQQPRRQNP